MNLLPSDPRCIGCNAPATVIDDPFLLCDSCEAALTQSMNSVGSAFPKADPVTAGDAQPPASPALAVTSNSDDDGIPPFLRRSHPDCVIKNSTAFRVAQASLSQAKSASSITENPNP